MSMIDLQKWADDIENYIRPSTFPLAVKLATAEEKIPDKMKIPGQDLKVKVATCQGFSISRRYGWSLAISADDISCPLTKVAFGFKPATDYYLEGNAAAGMYCQTKEIGSRTEAEVPRLPYGKYKYIFVSTIRRANFDPDLYIIYGNPAQVMRLLTAYLYKRGGYLHSRFSGRLDCADMVIETFNTDECQLILPCYGDRIFGLTQDDEMAFTVPKSKVQMTQEGLAGTHKGGIRYPIPTYLQFEGKFPESYTNVEKPDS
ncbi:MAG: hypothetical protein A2142_06370 [candidate division Zixibacteria bacterium RBG_16_48_11]|nr:MAG: hypothetical protein A2142_06370 [candidate division Zixibacteria bacterium RBG_16_48_11]